jgi:DNA-binding MarR family transcriptional regulator
MLQVVTEVLHREVGRDLWSDAQLSEAEFTVLAHLRLAGAPGARASDCARSIGWDSSRLSHQLRRLEKRGLILRSTGDGSDGRASVVALSDEGLSAYRRAIGPHMRSAQRWFADALDEDQLRALTEALEALTQHTTALATQRTGTETSA